MTDFATGCHWGNLAVSYRLVHTAQALGAFVGCCGISLGCGMIFPFSSIFTRIWIIGRGALSMSSTIPAGVSTRTLEPLGEAFSSDLTLFKRSVFEFLRGLQSQTLRI